jgi:outer membrane autotransporter protein
MADLSPAALRGNQTFVKILGPGRALGWLLAVLLLCSGPAAAEELAERSSTSPSQWLRVSERLSVGPTGPGKFSVINGTASGGVIFKARDGEDFYGGALEIQSDGKLLMVGAARFLDIGAGARGGAIDVAENGILHIELSRFGDEFMFYGTRADYDIGNRGVVLMKLAVNTRVMLDGKGIHSGEQDGTLKIVGPGEMDIGSSIIFGGSSEFVDDPIISFSIDGFAPVSSASLGLSGGEGAMIIADVTDGTRNNIWGDFYLNPRIPQGHYEAGTVKGYRYVRASGGPAKGNEYRPKLLAHVESGYGYSVGLVRGDLRTQSEDEEDDDYGGDYDDDELDEEEGNGVRLKDTLEFTFGKDTDVISGFQTRKLVVRENGVLTSKGSHRPLYFKSPEMGGAVEIEGNGEAYIVGSAFFIAVDGVRGVLATGHGDGKLSILMPTFHDSVEFQRTGKNMVDLYHQDSSGALELKGVRGASLRLSGGTKGGANSPLVIDGEFQLALGGSSLEEHNILVKGNPEITLSPYGLGRIKIENGGSLEGRPVIKAELSSEQAAELLAGRDYITYEYLSIGKNVDLTKYNPIIGMSDIEGQRGSFGTASDPRLFKKPSEFKSKFIIFPKKMSISGSRDSKVVVYGGQRVTNHGSARFSNIVRGEESDSILQVIDDGTLAIELDSTDDVVLFNSNGTGDGSRDIENSGTVLIRGPGAVRFGSGGVSGENGRLVLEGTPLLDLHGAKIDQKFVNLGTGTTLLLSAERVELARTPGETGEGARRGSGGSVRIQENGSLEGSPRIALAIGSDMATALGAMDLGEALELEYLFPAEGTSMAAYRPSLLNRFKFATVDGALERNGGEGTVASSQVAAELSFGGTEEQPDYATIVLRKREPRAVARDVVVNIVGGESGNKLKAMTTFFSSMVPVGDSEAQRVIEEGNVDGIRAVYRQHNPDTHLASQLKALATAVQSSAAVLADRMASPAELLSPNTSPMLAAAGDDRLAYGLLRDEAARLETVQSTRLWTQYIRNFGSQKLEENMKTSGSGFIFGLDHRFSNSLKLGAAFTMGEDSSKSDSGERDTKVTTRAISLYGEGGGRNFYLTALVTYGWNENKDNKLSTKGNILYLSPGLGYRFTLAEDKNLKLTLAPEIAIRYFRVHQDEQRDELDNRVSEVNRNILAPLLGLRLAALFGQKFDLTGRLGFSYDTLAKGDNSYLVTMRDGQSYQIVDERGDRAKFATEFGISLGYRVFDTLKLSFSYGGRYSSDLLNNSLALEASLRF